MNKILSALMLISAVAFTACTERPPINGGDKPQPSTPDTPKTEDVTVMPIPAMAVGTIPADAITPAQANEIGAALADQAVTPETYHIAGWVKKLHSKHEAGVTNPNYGNALFYISENRYSDDTYDKEDFLAYQVYGIGGAKITDLAQIQVGDYVVVEGPITIYNGTIETAGRGAAHIIASSNPNIEGVKTDVGEITYEEGEMSVSDCLANSEYVNLEAGQTTTTEFVVRGQVSQKPQVGLAYGTATFYITDGTAELYCYQLYAGPDKTKFVSGKQIQQGDIVTVKSVITNYNGTKEMKGGYVVRTTNTFDPSAVTGPEEITIARAIEIANGLGSNVISDEQYMIEGVISEVTEASTSYGNLTITVKDPATEAAILCYRIYYVDNAKYTGDPAIETGDVVKVVGQLKNQSGSTPKFVNGYLKSHEK